MRCDLTKIEGDGYETFAKIMILTVPQNIITAKNQINSLKE